MTAAGARGGRAGAAGRHREASRRDLKLALVLILGFTAVEVMGGLASGSLALLADAGHLFADSAAIGLALAAMHFAGRAATVRRTFGYQRLEILAALVNSLALLAIAGWVMVEAFGRIQEAPAVRGGLTFAVGAAGLAVNLAAARILHRSANHSLNVEGAFRHVVADLLSSVGVVVSGLLVWAFDWRLADPLISAVIAVLIVLSTFRLLSDVVHILLEGTPEHIDVPTVLSALEEEGGVTAIHDVHVWTISPGYEALTAHVITDAALSGPERDDLLRRLQQICTARFGIRQVTLQLEGSAIGCAGTRRGFELERRPAGPPPAGPVARDTP